jgi:DNA mismatch repair protein MutS
MTRSNGSRSILFDTHDDGPADAEPPFFADLNLDQVVAGIVAGREEYDLAPFFHAPLHTVEAVHYRHEIMRDLEREPVLRAVEAFAGRMGRMRQRLALARKLYYVRQQERWLLDAIKTYCHGVQTLAADLAAAELSSRGLLAFREYLLAYVESKPFATLVSDTEAREAELAGVTYLINIKGSRVRVSEYDGEADLSEEVLRTFAKFQESAVKDYRFSFSSPREMNHVEAQIVDLVARLHPDVFANLTEYCQRHRDYLDPELAQFDREVQFFLSYLGFIAPLKAGGLRFCYPGVSARSKEVAATAGFDLALASKVVSAGEAVVCNDFTLSDPERALVVSGPNQGGKTTFARMFGQLHYLGSLGLPVPAAEARLYLPDRIFTHFEREEDVANLRGKLEDELVRIREILAAATSDSLLIMNESFTSTTLSDAVLIGSEVMRQIVELGMLCVCVTFVDELASLGESTVSMMSTVVAEDPAVRTFKIVRKPADGLAYAVALAQKHGVTYERLKQRVLR